MRLTQVTSQVSLSETRWEKYIFELEKKRPYLYVDIYVLASIAKLIHCVKYRQIHFKKTAVDGRVTIYW